MDPLAATSNYFVGNDPRQWRSGIPTYGRVAYHDVYPGIDLVYYGNQQQLEYDFTVAPGADPGVIRLNVEGAESLALDGHGNLVLGTVGGDVVEHAPVLYQDSTAGRPAVTGRFVLEGSHQVGFALGAYDRARPLIIDPTLSYSTYLGGTESDNGAGIAVDAAGRAYVTGYTNSLNFPTTAGAFQTTHNPLSSVAFVTELNASGTALVYSTYLGGSGLDNATAIAVDAAGNAYVTGGTSSRNFPTTAGAFQTTLGNGGASNAFVTKLSPGGTALVYSTYLGGSGALAFGIAVDAAGNAYVAGTADSGFPTTPGGFQTTSPNGGAFVTKLNPTGTALVYSTYLGSSSSDIIAGIALGSFGNVYVTGSAGPASFPTTAGVFQPAYAGGVDAFVANLNATGSALIYSTYLGGSGLDDATAIAVDAAGNAYVTGLTTSSDFPTTAGAFQSTLRGSKNAFVVKLNAGATNLLYSTYLGGSGTDQGDGIAVDTAGNAYVVGVTQSGDFPTTPGALRSTLGGGMQNAFVTRLNTAGTALVYSTYLGGNKRDRAAAIVWGAAGNVYITGVTTSTDFPTTPGAFEPAFRGGANAFVAKLTFASPGRLFAVAGAPGRVLVYQADNTQVADFAPFGDSYTDPINVAVGDVNGDGIDDLVVGAAAGNPDVRVYDGRSFPTGTFDPTNPNASLLAEWFPYALQFDVGVNVAVGNIEHNGFADIVTGANVGNPDVHVYRGKDIANHTFNPAGASLIAQWFPYGLNFDVGANVAVGDVNGDGFADVVTGATAGNPDVRVYNGKDIAQGTFSSANPNASLRTQFFAYDLNFDIGAAVAAADFEGTGKFDILTGASAGAPHYRVVKGNATGTLPPAVFEGIPRDLQGGIAVGA